ncbi:MAG: ComF family protein [Terrimicrobiaceae bacterium]|nr:ComF family protein [Terrimicrobiaceae bacterium]
MRPGRATWRILLTLQGLLLPRQCCGCGRGLSMGWWCAECAGRLPLIRPPFCQRCSQPFDGIAGGEARCPNCGRRAFALEAAVAVLRSRGPVRDLIHRLKYAGAAWAARPLAQIARRAFHDPRLDGSCDALVPVPLHALRERERGYNQARLLAGHLAKFLHLPVAEPLLRIRRTETQTHFDRRRRMRNLQGAFALRQDADVKGKHLVLVDDVLTTGSTLEECARVLLQGGAASIRAVTAARG